RHDHMITYRHVVRDVRVSQDMILGTNDRLFAVIRRAMDRHIFPKGILVADAGSSQSAFPFQILGLQTKTGERENFILPPQRGVAINHHMRMQGTLRTQHHVLPDDAIRADPAVGANLRLGMNDGGGMYLGHGPSPFTSMNVTSASLTGSASTEQTPLARPILPRTLVSSTSITKVSP